MQHAGGCDERRSAQARKKAVVHKHRTHRDPQRRVQGANQTHPTMRQQAPSGAGVPTPTPPMPGRFLSPIACCILPIAYGSLHMAYGLLHMAYGLWPIAYGLWPIAYGLFLWPIAYGLWPIADGLWPIAYCLKRCLCMIGEEGCNRSGCKEVRR